MGFDIKKIIKEFIKKPHSRMHQVVIIVNIVDVATLTLCYSIMSHATLILFYHPYMLTIPNSSLSNALWLTRE